MYEFGLFRADPRRRELLHRSTRVNLSTKAFDALVVLIRSSGDTVTREQLMDAIWGDTAVEDNNLTQQISSLRKALGERPGEHKFIVTVPGRGYSFTAAIRTVSAETRETANATATASFVSKIDRARVIGYALALFYVLVICSPFLFSYTWHLTMGTQPQSLAVLQFRVATGDEFIGTGISDTLRARLGSIEDLTIRAAPAPALGSDAVSTGRELSVDAVITGSVQRADTRVRVTVEMIDIADGRVVWGRTFDDDFGNIFALQDAIAGEVARALEVRSTGV